MFVSNFLFLRQKRTSLQTRPLIYQWLFLLTMLVLGNACNATTDDSISQTRVTQKDEIGAYHWIVKTPNDISFEFIQRIPDQTRAFYIARNFSAEAASEYATACIFQTILTNNSKDKVVKINLSNWRVIKNNKKIPLQLDSDWQQKWIKMNLSKSSRIAFRWSQFPTIQEHKPGDWFQGMLAANLLPDTKFNLYIQWKVNDKVHEATIQNLQCAVDRTLD